MSRADPPFREAFELSREAQQAGLVVTVLAPHRCHGGYEFQVGLYQPDGTLWAEGTHVSARTVREAIIAGWIRRRPVPDPGVGPPVLPGTPDGVQKLMRHVKECAELRVPAHEDWHTAVEDAVADLGDAIRAAQHRQPADALSLLYSLVSSLAGIWLDADSVDDVYLGSDSPGGVC